MAEMAILSLTPSKCSLCLAFSLVLILLIANNWDLLTVKVDSLKIGYPDARIGKGFRSVQFSTSSPLRGRKQIWALIPYPDYITFSTSSPLRGRKLVNLPQLRAYPAQSVFYLFPFTGTETLIEFNEIKIIKMFSTSSPLRGRKQSVGIF